MIIIVITIPSFFTTNTVVTSSDWYQHTQFEVVLLYLQLPRVVYSNGNGPLITKKQRDGGQTKHQCEYSTATTTSRTRTRSFLHRCCMLFSAGMMVRTWSQKTRTTTTKTSITAALPPTIVTRSCIIFFRQLHPHHHCNKYHHHHHQKWLLLVFGTVDAADFATATAPFTNDDDIYKRWFKRDTHSIDEEQQRSHNKVPLPHYYTTIQSFSLCVLPDWMYGLCIRIRIHIRIRIRPAVVILFFCCSSLS